MQYLIFVFIVCFIIFAVGWFTAKISGMKNLFLQKILAKKIIGRGIFSTLAVKQICRYILKQPANHRQKMLADINKNDFEELLKNIDDSLLKAKLGLMLGHKETAEQNPDVLYLLMLADYSILQNNYDSAVLFLQQINGQKLSLRLKAYQSLLTAKIALFEADLQTASEEVGRALKVFQKNNLLFEEAVAYYVLGTIYRVSGVFDAADFMLRSALKMFKFVNATKFEAEILGNFGLLMAVQKRFEEASSYFADAEKLFSSIGDDVDQSFVICQRAMLALLQNDSKSALKLIQPVLKKQKNPAVLALASDIVGRCAFASEKWAKAAKASVEAASYYFKQKNYSAAFESLYLQAESLVKQNLFDEAELVLRELIRKEKYHRGCFHVANAHTLLGLIFLQKNDIKRAKTIFNQALEQELHNDRTIGIAIDYANLAAAERKCGNIQAAHKNLTLALSYAKDADEELWQQIKSVLD